MLAPAACTLACAITWHKRKMRELLVIEGRRNITGPSPAGGVVIRMVRPQSARDALRPNATTATTDRKIHHRSQRLTFDDSASLGLRLRKGLPGGSDARIRLPPAALGKTRVTVRLAFNTSVIDVAAAVPPAVASFDVVASLDFVASSDVVSANASLTPWFGSVAICNRCPSTIVLHAVLFSNRDGLNS